MASAKPDEFDAYVLADTEVHPEKWTVVTRPWWALSVIVRTWLG
ncbi:hypothetical protein [Rhodococcus sp. (in: high G+C Gram-positive bacteria)]|nr:hypothetical protein [Rhodococcus sp. (in: high G+C Gram-positive bacteria)]